MSKKKFLSNTHYTKFNEKYYHELCFTCSSYNKSIINKNFYHLLCEMTLEKYELCKKIIDKGHIIIFQDKKYHDVCMRCAKYKDNIGGTICFTKNKDEI